MCNRNKIFILHLIVLLLSKTVAAEYRSNLYLFVQSMYTPPIQFDFSEITDSSFEHHDSNIVQADVYVSIYTSPMFIASPYGVYCYGDVDFFYNEGWWLDPDSIAIYKEKGDSIIWGFNITAPQNGYQDTIRVPTLDSVKSRIFIVKTSEEQHALFILVAVYIGALERYQFYWALQTDSSGIFQEQSYNKFTLSKNGKNGLFRVTQTNTDIVVTSLIPKPSPGSLSLYNIKGKEVYSIDNNHSNKISINKSNLSKGCYILQVKTGRNFSDCYNIIITQ